ncbi:hypothetical protein PLANPX_5415 [Lacipirellula parvula]|uniref:Uncharacterized protein n=1 Tax=Lacipirellula parvula TaxID=2650471 RepID=A0A5K7XMH0_9BACT|nr:hypothetical protein PLANPX_5415 [Lacipirellula parvula]
MYSLRRVVDRRLLSRLRNARFTDPEPALPIRPVTVARSLK